MVTGGTVTPADPGDTVPVADAYTINWADKEIVVDGVFSEEEWSDANALHLTGMTGRRDTCSGTLYFKYDGCCVYMAAVVNDPTPMRNGGTGDNIWWGDSLELFYGTDLSQRNEMSDQDIQVLISGSEEYGDQNTFHYGDEKVYQAFKDMDVGLRTDENGNEIGYTVEAIIPLELFRIDEAPWTGEQILFNANIKDGDGGQIGWTNTEEAGKCDPGTWKLVTFAVHAAPADDITVGATVDPTTRVVTLTGQAVRAERQQLTVLVTDANGSIAYVNQFQSNDDGSYTLRFPVHEAGVYTVTVGGKRIKKPVSTTLTLENTLKI